HLSLSHNMWRHLTMFIGGQGIILASLSILTKARSVAVGFYIGEARQEKILPNVIGTARFIWKVSFIYLIMGVLTYGTLLYLRGVPLIRSFYHGLWLFFASFDTGGFAPQSQNVAYYHSLSLEIATLVFMTLGAINFNFHFWVWTKDRKEIFKNFEIRTFMISMFILTVMLYVPIKAVGSLTLFRQGFYQLLSAHTGCGFASISATALSRYPSLSLLAVIFAMMIGGAVCSTTGAIKLMRVGIIFKSFFTEIKRWMMPFKSVYRDRFHHLQDLILSDKRVKDAYFYCALFLCVYMIGAIIGMFYGYSPMHSLFESVSATANVGLSVGITNAAMPLGLKLVYLFQMWAGRLEFLSVFVTIGFLVTMFKK
ncbi:MAG: potassium transporter TrkG, partial [Candidatus Omnitrophica bacterium]|nr:potassium transporter TrkG [Candidatus Omnitrophota bacterium]